jgi:hypothetical protein
MPPGIAIAEAGLQCKAVIELRVPGKIQRSAAGKEKAREGTHGLC